MKGLFIPGITAEMLRNGCLEGIEALMAEGEIYDIDYDFNKPEPCEDTISRQAALNAVFNNTESPNKAYKAIRILPSAQPEPCEDAISRKQIKEKLQYVIDHGFAAADGHHPVSAERVLGYIIKMSSVAPKPRIGKWLINSDGYYPYCSECKAEPKSGEMTDFCPKCGAKMEG